jgi:hypothetical protein
VFRTHLPLKLAIVVEEGALVVDAKYLFGTHLLLKLAIVVEEGTLVVDAKYLNMVSQSQCWYTLSSLQTKVQLQQAVQPNLPLTANVGNDRLPDGCNKLSARSFGARRVSEEPQEEIIYQLTGRAIIEHEDTVQEDVLKEEDDDDVEDAPDGASSDNELED